MSDLDDYIRRMEKATDNDEIEILQTQQEQQEPDYDVYTYADYLNNLEG